MGRKEREEIRSGAASYDYFGRWYLGGSALILEVRDRPSVRSDCPFCPFFCTRFGEAAQLNFVHCQSPDCPYEHATSVPAIQEWIRGGFNLTAARGSHTRHTKPDSLTHAHNLPSSPSQHGPKHYLKGGGSGKGKGGKGKGGIDRRGKGKGSVNNSNRGRGGSGSKGGGSGRGGNGGKGGAGSGKRER